MKTRALVLTSAAVAALGVAACAQMQVGLRTAASASVMVNVTACNPGGVNVTPDTVHVSPGTNTTIRWQINRGYDFPATNAIQFKGPAFPPGGVFTPGNKQGTGAFAMDDSHSGSHSKGRFPYRIIILKADGSACTAKDPDIMND
jgi:hypothetical protein